MNDPAGAERHEAARAAITHSALPSDPIALDRIDLGRACSVISVTSAAQAPDSGRWLAEIGFVPGERATVLTRAPGGDPLMVRIGHGSFALRRWEAACVSVRPLPLPVQAPAQSLAPPSSPSPP